MGYNVEISFSILNHGNVTELKGNITELALDYNCNHYYYIYEMEGGTKFPRNHCIIVVNFDDEEIFNCAKFIKQIRRLHDIHLECIYEDSLQCKLIYASKFYLKNVDKHNVILYNKFKRERSHSENEATILNEVDSGRNKPRSGSLT